MCLLEVFNVSVDRLTLVGGVSDRKLLEGLNHNPFVKGQGRAKFPYDYTFYMQDGSLLQLAPVNSDVRPLRYDFNPNKWNKESMKDSHLMSILRLFKNAVPTRIDVAIDIKGQDLGKFEWRDMKSRKREIHQDGVGRLETLYIGSDRSDTRLRIYNKKKERQDKGSEIGKDLDHWWRVEAQMRGTEAEEYLLNNPFSDIAMTKEFSVDEDGLSLNDYDVRTRAMLYYLQQFPKAMEELSPNVRTKYKQMLTAVKDYASEESLSEVYENNKDLIRDQVNTFLNCTDINFSMNNPEGESHPYENGALSEIRASMGWDD